MNITKLQDKKDQLQKTYDRLKKASQDAEGAMQSWHDTQKDQYESEARMVKQQIDQLDSLIEELSGYGDASQHNTVAPGSVILLSLNNGPAREFLIVNQHGGISIDNIQTLSSRSPIGQAVLWLHPEDKKIISVDGKQIILEVVSIR